MPSYILLVCERNAGRSQMCQAFFNHIKREEFTRVNPVYEAISAGTSPGKQVNPLVVQVMKEVGINMSDPNVYFCKGLDSDYVVSRKDDIKRVMVVCDDISCVFPGQLNHLSINEVWDLPDTRGQPLERVKQIRAIIRDKVFDLLRRLEMEDNLYL